jgi:hypothetical protein
MLNLPAELFEPRRNDDIADTIRAIRREVALLARERSHAARRGYAYVLIEQLNHLLESAEFRPPLVTEGAVEDGDYWLEEKVLEGCGLPFLGPRPFDAGGSGYFIEFLGRLSPLFATLPPDDAPFYDFPGTSVAVFRLDHTTTAITARHLTERDAAARLAQLAKLQRPVYGPDLPSLFFDPRGYGPRGGAVQDSLELGSSGDLAAAIAAADALSAAVRIRLIVATRVRHIDNH